MGSESGTEIPSSSVVVLLGSKSVTTESMSEVRKNRHEHFYEKINLRKRFILTKSPTEETRDIGEKPKKGRTIAT